MKYHLLIFAIGALILFSCESNEKKGSQVTHEPNPPAPGFNESGSDAKAVDIADQVMEAMGGRKNWDNEQFFTWNFFGARSLWWDKLKGDVRVETHNADSIIVLLNIFDDTGRVSVRGQEYTQADSVAKYVKRGKAWWINDGYWLFMPFKLKDTGVTLTYVGEDTTQSGNPSDVLQLTFEDVGNTPQNKYHVWVDKSDHLVKQWAFFRQNDMEEPNFITPWVDYKKYGSIVLSGNRGQRQITDIEVAEYMDESIFKSF